MLKNSSNVPVFNTDALITTNCKEKQGKKDKRIKELREVEHQMVRGNSLDYFTTYFMFSTNSCTFNTDAQPKDNTKKTKRMKQLRKVKHQLSEGKNPEHILHLASFPDLPIILFLIACSMRKRRGKASTIYHMSDVTVYQIYKRGGGALEQKACLRPFLCSVDPCTGDRNVCEAKKLLLIVHNKECVWEIHAVHYRSEIVQ